MKAPSRRRPERLRVRPEDLPQLLRALPHCDRAGLIAHWHRLYGTMPPRGISQALMVRAIAYRLQEQALGTLKPSTHRSLIKLAEGSQSASAAAVLLVQVKPGTRLLREWHGVTHEVAIKESGVEFNGTRYRSLSEVARVITGARWSGPLFFGLKKSVKGRAA